MMKITYRNLRRIIKEEIELSLSEIENPCWDGYSPGAQTGVKTKKGKGGNRVANCEEISEDVGPTEGKSFDKDLYSLSEDEIKNRQEKLILTKKSP